MRKVVEKISFENVNNCGLDFLNNSIRIGLNNLYDINIKNVCVVKNKVFMCIVGEDYKVKNFVDSLDFSLSYF